VIGELLQTAVSRVSAAGALSRSHDGADALAPYRAVHLPALVLTGIRHLTEPENNTQPGYNSIQCHFFSLGSIALSYRIKTPQSSAVNDQVFALLCL